MATVWRGRDTSLGRPVAIKRLHPHIAGDEEAADRFKREALSAASLTHPGVVTVFDAGEDEVGPFIVMEYVEGETLANVLRRQGRLPPEQATDIGAQAAEALEHAHSRGLIHRDVKPANILMTADGRVKLADFGIARSLEETDRITRTGSVIGTAAYLAPEQAAGDAGDVSSDVYALGVVLYEMLTGRVPFTAETPLAVALAHQTRTPEPPSAHAPVPPDLESILMRALAKEPVDRYASAGDLARELRRWEAMADGVPGVGPQPASTDDTRPMVTRPASVQTRVLGRPSAPARREAQPPAVSPWLLGLLLLVLLAGVLVVLASRRSPVASPPTTAAAAQATTVPTLPATTEPTPASTTPQTTTTSSPSPQQAFADLQEYLQESAEQGAIRRREWNQLRGLADEAEQKWREGELRESSQRLEEMLDRARRELERGRITSEDFVSGLEKRTERVREVAGLPPPERDEDDDDD